jgi:hypothetical protein
MLPFRAVIALVGINPFVSVPRAHLQALFEAAGRESGPIPIRVVLGEESFQQNLVKYQGQWRLYLNTPMRRAAGKEVGQRVTLSVEYDPEPRIEPMQRRLKLALAAEPAARSAFDALAPSRQKEILRYLNQAKTDATRERNVGKVVRFLLGEEPAGLAALVRPPKRTRL